MIIDTTCAANIAKDQGLDGAVLSASSYFMKSPPVQYDDTRCRQEVEELILGVDFVSDEPQLANT